MKKKKKKKKANERWDAESVGAQGGISRDENKVCLTANSMEMQKGERERLSERIVIQQEPKISHSTHTNTWLFTYRQCIAYKKYDAIDRSIDPKRCRQPKTESIEGKTLYNIIVDKRQSNNDWWYWRWKSLFQRHIVQFVEQFFFLWKVIKPMRHVDLFF